MITKIYIFLSYRYLRQSGSTFPLQRVLKGINFEFYNNNPLKKLFFAVFI